MLPPDVGDLRAIRPRTCPWHPQRTTSGQPRFVSIFVFIAQTFPIEIKESYLTGKCFLRQGETGAGQYATRQRKRPCGGRPPRSGPVARPQDLSDVFRRVPPLSRVDDRRRYFGPCDAGSRCRRCRGIQPRRLVAGHFRAEDRPDSRPGRAPLPAERGEIVHPHQRGESLRHGAQIESRVEVPGVPGEERGRHVRRVEEVAVLLRRRVPGVELRRAFSAARIRMSGEKGISSPDQRPSLSAGVGKIHDLLPGVYARVGSPRRAQPHGSWGCGQRLLHRGLDRLAVGLDLPSGVRRPSPRGCLTTCFPPPASPPSKKAGGGNPAPAGKDRAMPPRARTLRVGGLRYFCASTSAIWMALRRPPFGAGRRTPTGSGVVRALVLADPAYVTVVLPRAEQRHGVQIAAGSSSPGTPGIRDQLVRLLPRDLPRTAR